MARIDCTGAELGSVNELDSTSVGLGGTFSASTAQAKSGIRSWRAQYTPAAAAGQAKGTMNVSGAPTQFAVKFSLYVPSSNGVTNQSILQVNFGALEFVEIQRTDSAGSFSLRARNSSGGTSASISNLPYSMWINGCIRATINTGIGVAETATLRIQETSVTTPSENFATAGVSSVVFGLTADLNVNFDIFFDDIVIDNSNADITDAKFLWFIQPNGDDSTSWGTVGGGNSHAERLRDNADGTVVNKTGAGANDIEKYNTGPLSGTLPTNFIIPAVYGSVRDSLAGTTQAVYRYRFTVGANTTESTNITTSLVNTTRRSIFIKTNSPSSASWAESDIDALSLGLLYPAGQLATAGAQINEQWAYAEISSSLLTTSTYALSESFQILGTASLSEPISSSDSFLINATASITENTTLSESLGILVAVNLTSSFSSSDEASYVIYVPQSSTGSGVSTTLTQTIYVGGSSKGSLGRDKSITKSITVIGTLFSINNNELINPIKGLKESVIPIKQKKITIKAKKLLAEEKKK